MSVIRHNFGIESRKIARRFRSLLRLNALHEANVRTNPVPYLERASERIYQLEKVLFEAVEAATSQPSLTASPETIEVNKAEYQRLLACRAIVENGFEKLVTGDEET
jgi:hypothetical protein